MLRGICGGNEIRDQLICERTSDSQKENCMGSKRDEEAAKKERLGEDEAAKQRRRCSNPVGAMIGADDPATPV